MKKFRGCYVCNKCTNNGNGLVLGSKAYFLELRNRLQNKREGLLTSKSPCNNQLPQDFDEVEQKTGLSERNENSSLLHANYSSKRLQDKSTQYVSHDHSHKHLECSDEIVIQIPKHLKATSITIQFEHNNVQTPSSAHRSSLSDRF